ncbi:hypothetical protein MOBT1_001609 [Malassezia obtusa]|uniref:Uncharacterized protein n=1 Tax=Malassezia obtusa TaxID=76774 RepID=A0AAF0E095_9BASI|nr:hypothetical protein MOBT1_001609 [Malassezia obtusa]
MSHLPAADAAASSNSSRYMDELTTRLLAQAQQLTPERQGEELDSTTAASLETFMASLKAHLQLPPDAWSTPHTKPQQPWHQWTSEQRHAHVREYLREAPHGAPAGLPAVMTTVRCLHAAVAQKSYGTEKRFLCPPPTVQVRGPLRHASHAPPVLSMQIQGEDGERFSGEQCAHLDETQSARFTELHVTGTGKAKSFRLQLHLAARLDAEARDAKRARAEPEVPAGTWASFDSAPIGIISKPSKKSAKARHASAHITTQTPVSLFNRINSQTYRTKYLAAHDGHLSAQSRAWTAFRLVHLARPPQAHALEIEPEVLTYGSTVVLVDEASSTTTDPLVVCKVDRGRILPPFGATHITLDDGTVADESYLYGAVSQMQKIALLRYVPGARHADAPWVMDPHAPRAYLCAGTAVPIDAQNAALRHALDGAVSPLAGDAQALPLTYAPSKPVAWAGGAVLDDAEDAFCWTMVSISHFEYSFVDTDLLDAPAAPLGTGVPLTPFPIVTTLPFYDTSTHKLAMTVQHFAARDTDGTSRAKEVWLGALGPLPVLTASVPDSNEETEVLVELPPLRNILGGADGAAATQCTLPLLFVRASDGAIYHSGRQVLCQDLVAVVRAAGDHRAAEALKKLNVGLGKAAGAHDLPAGSAWTIRVV